MKKKLFTLIMMLISFSIQIFAQMRDYTAMVVDAETGEAFTMQVSILQKTGGQLPIRTESSLFPHRPKKSFKSNSSAMRTCG